MIWHDVNRGGVPDARYGVRTTSVTVLLAADLVSTLNWYSPGATSMTICTQGPLANGLHTAGRSAART